MSGDTDPTRALSFGASAEEGLYRLRGTIRYPDAA